MSKEIFSNLKAKFIRVKAEYERSQRFQTYFVEDEVLSHGHILIFIFDTVRKSGDFSAIFKRSPTTALAIRGTTFVDMATG